MTFRRVAVVALAALAVTAGPVLAQRRDPRLIADSAGKYVIPFCNLKMAGKIPDGQGAMRAGIEEKDAAKRAAALDRAQKILADAVTTGGQGANASGWYFLARTDLLRGDVAGADSAFTKAEALAPDCEIDIHNYRQSAWAKLATVGIELQRGGQSDSALYYFRGASMIFTKLPHVYENMGVIFANANANDSAAVYFAKALAISEKDSTLVDNRNSASVNLAMVLQRSGKHQEAIAVLRQYLTWNPKDTDGRKSIAFSFREAGMVDSAEAVEKAMVAEFSQMNLDSLTPTDLMAVGVSMFNAQKLDEAATIFSKIAAQNPWSRDAVYNLANAYLALSKWDKLVETGKQLQAIEPLNEDSYRLIGQGYKELKQQDNLVKTAESLVSMPVHIEVTMFAMGQTTTRFRANATGRNAMDVTGKPLKPVPVSIAVEFVNEAGAVLAAQDISIPALEPGQAMEIKADGKAAGITGWRYKRK